MFLSCIITSKATLKPFPEIQFSFSKQETWYRVKRIRDHGNLDVGTVVTNNDRLLLVCQDSMHITPCLIDFSALKFFKLKSHANYESIPSKFEYLHRSLIILWAIPRAAWPM